MLRETITLIAPLSVILTLTVATGCGGKEKSKVDHTFEKGLEKYNNKEYREAKIYFGKFIHQSNNGINNKINEEEV